jgi:hypothetical protein
MIHESIDPQNNARVLINLNQVAHVTMHPGQEHINVQFGSGSLRLNCASHEAAQDQYASIKQCMQGQSTNEHKRAQTPSRTRCLGDNEFGTVFSLHEGRNDP